MKKLFIMLAMFFAVSLITSPVVEAKKFGSNKSAGKTQKTEQSQPAATNTTATNTTAAPATAAPTAKKGMMGGMLGGLLAGGLLAALFMGEGFENIQIMDIVIIALLAFVLFKVIRMLMASKAQAQPRPAYSGAGQASAAPGQDLYRQQSEGAAFGGHGGNSGFAQPQSTVPFHLPPGFDLAAFLEGARGHYKTLQQAWNEGDLNKIQEYVSIELFNELSQQRRELEGEQH
ncbi:Tim44 domain-containing protein, partial [Shewanella sp.]|uniref:Tim44 domain-containing protein n=1 Tax=Shewanella sp. TaxID=50422 RepID=UPI00356B382E